MLQPNSPVPHFSLPDQDGLMHTTDELRGKWVLLYFYPKDDTPGCTKEACGFRDNFAQFEKAGLMVIGVSKDPVRSHKKFQEKYQLPFALLSDTTTEVNQAFGVWAKKKFMGREYMGTLRTTFLINPQSKIEKVYENVNPAEHAQEILKDFEMLSLS